ncbi:hypothetical protein QTP81_10705 [Alteromonas sp. ASW11-36]|uniref:Lipoprotein n=1 Tax=Alteromonas arenosi TaxID=3055817 RepID=A0ABT7SXZ3_9ALTE|nr:hypothetical protein [Alteromonas sp. ASW11-36]MDM7861066.1 hypothetical protein [Alteromonas sp. ASW11-36]
MTILVNGSLLRCTLIAAVLLMQIGCGPKTLPTVGRTHGDLPMTMVMELSENCWRFLKPVYFEAPFATGMSFNQGSCLAPEKKIGRKTVAQIASMKVSMTYDGEFYIVKNGYE